MFFLVLLIIWIVILSFSAKKKTVEKGKILSQKSKKRLPKAKYREYITSHKWREKAKVIRKRDGYQCRLCHAKNVELHVHHATYDRLGYEHDLDLITLCAPCHKKFHNKK